MIFLKEYKENKKNMSEWVPFSGLVTDNILRNKDGSLMGFLHYTSKQNIKDLELAVKKVCELLNLPSGWVIWLEKSRVSKKNDYYITFVWNPIPDKDGYVEFPKEFYEKPIIFDSNTINSNLDKCLESFSSFLKRAENIIGSFVNVRLLKNEEVINYLYSTVSNNKKIEFPDIPMYLDYYLTQDNKYNNVDSRFSINDVNVSILSLLGYPGSALDVAFKKIDKINIDYRFVRRFICFSNEDLKKEVSNYMTGWCNNRKYMVDLLGFNSKNQCGYYDTTMVILNDDENKIKKLYDSFCDSGIPVAIEQYKKQYEVWFSTIPGMFRSNIHPPVIEMLDISDLILIPEEGDY